MLRAFFDSHRMHAAHALGACALICALSGCSSGSKGDASRSDAKAAAQERRAKAAVLRDRLTNANNGLEVRRLTVVDATDRVMSVLAKYVDGPAVDEDVLNRLKRNGFRLVRVPAGEVAAIAADLGGATLDRNEWHGQVYEWRSLRDQPVDRRGAAVAIDGRVRRFDRGEFRLLVRGWTLMMESGPHLHLEALPQHRLPQSTDLRRLLGESPEDAGETFASLALDLQLEAGFAYVLVSEPPNVDWPEVDQPAARAPNANSDDDESAGAAAAGSFGETVAAPPPALRPMRGPDATAGPEAGAPLTLGEILLPTLVSPPTRELLVFVPRIPEALFPPVYESDLESGRTNGQASIRNR